MPVIADAPAAYSGLELLATAVFLLQFDRCIAYANPAAENLFEMSRTKLIGQRVNEISSAGSPLRYVQFGNSKLFHRRVLKAHVFGELSPLLADGGGRLLPYVAE